MGAAASAFGSSPRASTVTRARQPKRAAVGEGVRVASTELLGLEEHPKEEREKQLIALAVSRSILFAPLRDFPHLLDAVVAAMFPVCAPAGEVLITQGDPLGDTFYVLSTGECAIVVDGREVARAGAGDSFGELALLYASPRTSTVTALVPTRLWALRLAAYKAAAAAAAAAGAERLASAYLRLKRGSSQAVAANTHPSHSRTPRGRGLFFSAVARTARGARPFNARDVACY